MFHRNRNHDQHPQKKSTSGGFFHRRAPAYVGNPHGYYRDPYYEGATRSDWDHYAVRHEEALIGDPLPILHNGLNMASNAYAPSAVGPYGPGPIGHGPLNHGYDDTHYNRRHPVPTNLDKFGNPMIGPVVANSPLHGNLSSGTVVEKNFVRGPGKDRTFDVEPNARMGWASTGWGADPLGGAPDHGYGSALPYPGQPIQQHRSWGSQPLYGYRDSRMEGRATPLLPDNPWTHNELGRDWSDGYKRGTTAFGAINNAFVSHPVTNTFVTRGPNGERIEGTQTRVIREEIVPLGGSALGTKTTVVDTKIIKDEPRLPIVGSTVPIAHSASHEVVTVERGVTETGKPVTIVKEQFV